MQKKRVEPRLKRKRRIHLRIRGTQLRPRIAIYRSLRNMFASVVDDENHKTLFFLSTTDMSIKEQLGNNTGNVKAAEVLGAAFARRLKEKGIKQVVFDRCGYLYHGRVKAFADALRKEGLEF